MKVLACAAGIAAFGLFALGSPALGHLEEDQGPTLGEYRATLESITILPGKLRHPFGRGLLAGDHVDLLIWTKVQAETHNIQNAVFEIRNAVVGEGEQINRLIYWHIDCVPGERLKPQVKVGILERGAGIAQPASGLLEGGGGIVTDDDPDRPPGSPGAAGYSADIENGLREALGHTVLPTYDVEGFAIKPDSGTLRYRPRGVPAEKATFSIEVTYRYRPLPASCARKIRWNVIKQEVQRDRAVRNVVRGTTDSDGDGYNNRTERACGSNPNDANSTPIFRRGRCVRVRHRRPPRVRPHVTGSGTFTSDQSGLAFSASFSAAINTFEIAVPGGRQVTAVQAPTGFSCRVASFDVRGDAYLCRGHLAANTTVQGAIQTNPPPVVGMGGELVGSSGRVWFGVFGVLGPAFPPPLACTGQFATPIPNNNPLNFAGQCNQAINGVGIVVPGGRQIVGVPAGCSAGTTNTPNDTLLCPANVPANQSIQLQTGTNPRPTTGMGGQLFVVQGAIQSGFFAITGP